jgi:peptidyl-tRNA hydrolase
VETLTVDGQNVTVITIKADLIETWYEEGLDQVVLHVEDEKNPKFF